MISIIIPTWNRPGMIMDALDSIDKQDYSKYEVIVAQNGMGGDYSLVHKRINHNSKYKLFQLEHPNECDAVNYGLDQAQGDIITVLHDDDYFNGIDNLSLRLNALDSHEVVYTDAIKASGRNFSRWKLFKSKPPDKALIWDDEYISFNSLMWRKSIHDKVGYFERSLPFAGDLLFKILVIQLCDCVYLPLPTMINRIHNNRLSTISTKEIVTDETSRLMKILKEKYNLQKPQN